MLDLTDQFVPEFKLDRNAVNRLKEAQEVLSKALASRLLDFEIENDLIAALNAVENLLDKYVTAQNEV